MQISHGTISAPSCMTTLGSDGSTGSFGFARLCLCSVGLVFGFEAGSRWAVGLSTSRGVAAAAAAPALLADADAARGVRSTRSAAVSAERAALLLAASDAWPCGCRFALPLLPPAATLPVPPATLGRLSLALPLLRGAWLVPLPIAPLVDVAPPFDDDDDAGNKVEDADSDVKFRGLCLLLWLSFAALRFRLRPSDGMTQLAGRAGPGSAGTSRSITPSRTSSACSSAVSSVICAART